MLENEDLGFGNIKEEIVDESDSLIFPINVHESLQASAGLKKNEKIGIIISIWVFVCLFFGWVMLGWLRQFTTYYIWITVSVELLLQGTVGMYILRFIMDERSLFAEMNNSDLSFANYFRLYKEIRKENSTYPFDLLEFDDGTYGVYIQLRLGHNTQRRSNNTYYLNKELESLLLKSNLACKMIMHTESFKESEAAEDLRSTLKDIEDPKLFSTYRDIIQNYLDIAEEQSNVMCVTLIVYAQTRISKDSLAEDINRILNIFKRNENVYREVSILTYEQIVEFLRMYYKLEVLDMGLIRSHIAERKKSFNCPVKVVKIYGKSGKIYVNDEFNKIRDEIISEGGIKQVR